MCPTVKFWSGLYKTINNYLDGTTIADLVHNAQENNEDFSYYI